MIACLLILCTVLGAPPVPPPGPPLGPPLGPTAPSADLEPDAQTVLTEPVSVEQADEPECHDFIEEIRLLSTVTACTDLVPLPAEMDASVVEEYCIDMRKRMEKYRTGYAPRAREFISKLLPGDLSPTIVYPFGGGDLLSVLTTFPFAREITTISMEFSGDPRRLASISESDLAGSLELLKHCIRGLLCCNNSKTDSLQKIQRGGIAGQLAFFLVGLAIYNFEPLRVRFFEIRPDGTLDYLSLKEIAAHEQILAKKFRRMWVNPDFSEAFSNVEIEYRERGVADAPVRVHRHIAANLGDDGIPPGLLAYLEQRKNVTAITKAASYLLWKDQFSKIRDYLLHNMVFMISDSTGLPPRFAKAAGFEQETIGRFVGSFLRSSSEHNEAFRKLWRSQPFRPLPFRYGYIDSSGNYHMLLTRRPLAPPSGVGGG